MATAPGWVPPYSLKDIIQAFIEQQPKPREHVGAELGDSYVLDFPEGEMWLDVRESDIGMLFNRLDGDFTANTTHKNAYTTDDGQPYPLKWTRVE